jgi:carboxypeptidase family protein
MSLLCLPQKCCKLLRLLPFCPSFREDLNAQVSYVGGRCTDVFGVGVLVAGLGAQSFQGGLRGVVKDPQGVIPGVTVTLVNDQNGVSRETVSNGVGEYSFPAIEPATYTVRAAVQGFKTVERKGVRIGTQEFIALDIQLEVGGLEETITVTGESPLIDTTSASTGDVLDTKSQVERVAQLESGRRLPDHWCQVAQLRRVDGHLQLHRRLQRQPPRGHAARLSAEHEQYSAEHAARWFRAVRVRFQACTRRG